jgi:hypothetical protein
MEHRNIEERLPRQRDITKFKISARHNLGKLELAFSYKFKAAEAYKAYRNALNSAHRFFKEALAMGSRGLMQSWRRW